MKRLLALLLVAGAATALYLWPSLVAREVLSDLARGDEEAVAAAVDFAALRANLKARLTPSEAEAPAGLVGEIVRGLAKTVGGGLVDTLVTPSGLVAFVELKGEATKRALADPKVRWIDPAHAEATAGEGDDALTLVFERRGLDWKVVDLRFDVSSGPASQSRAVP